MARLIVILFLCTRILITYQSTSVENSEKRFLFVNEDANIFSRRPSKIIDFDSFEAGDLFSSRGNDLVRQKRDSNSPISFRSDGSLPRNISASVSSWNKFFF